MQAVFGGVLIRCEQCSTVSLMVLCYSTWVCYKALHCGGFESSINSSTKALCSLL